MSETPSERTITMHNVKTIQAGRYQLAHEWYVDDFGRQRNAAELFDKENRAHMPFQLPLRVSKYSTDEALAGDNVEPFTDAEYEEILAKEIAVYESLRNKK